MQDEYRHYHQLQISVDEIADIGEKSKFSSNIVVPPDKYALLQEQALAYRVNKPEIEALRERERKLKNEKHRLEEKSQSLSDYDKQLKVYAKHIDAQTKESAQLWDMATLPGVFQSRYNEMERLLSENLPKVKRLEQKLADSVPKREYNELEFKAVIAANDNRRLTEACRKAEAALQAERTKNAESNALLRKESDGLRAIIAERESTIDKLREILANVATALKNAVKAMGMLKYDERNDYAAELSPKQGRLIDGIANFSRNLLQRLGFKSHAEEINKHIGISQDIEQEIDKLTPPGRSQGISR